MTTENDYEDSTEDTDDTTPPQRPAATATGFEPPDGATRARFRRMNPDTGGWEDAQVICDGVRTAIVDAESASPNLPLVEPIATTYRITWYSSNNRVCGYSKNWRPGSRTETTGGVSNTPRMWPAGAGSANAVTHGPPSGFLSSADTLALMRGLSLVVHEAAAPMIAQVHMFAEQTLARERAFHEARMLAVQQQAKETMERDRAFMAAMREVHEVPRDAKIRELQAEIAELKRQDEEADAEEEEEEKKRDANAWNVANTVAENAPEIIRTIAEEVRNFKGAEEKLSGNE